MKLYRRHQGVVRRARDGDGAADGAARCRAARARRPSPPTSRRRARLHWPRSSTRSPVSMPVADVAVVGRSRRAAANFRAHERALVGAAQCAGQCATWRRRPRRSRSSRRRARSCRPSSRRGSGCRRGAHGGECDAQVSRAAGHSESSGEPATAVVFVVRSSLGAPPFAYSRPASAVSPDHGPRARRAS